MKRSTIVRTAGLALLFAAPNALAAGAPIQLSTVRIVVGPRERTAGITLSNMSGEPQRYRVSIADMVMDGNGGLSEVKEERPPRARLASSWVIATPATVHLAPRESQKIRLLIRRPGGTEDGEYRTHLRVAQEPPSDAAGGLQEKTTANDRLQFKLTTVYEMTVPIFIQQGQIQSTASIAEAHIVAGGKQVALVFKRDGNSAFRGFVQATAGNSGSVYWPLVIYPEVDQMSTAFELGALVNPTGPLTLSLYAGAIPEPGERPVTKMLSSIRVPE